MNAAEITDKLGLQSLRQRIWVSFEFTLLKEQVLILIPVHPIDLCYFWRWSV